MHLGRKSKNQNKRVKIEPDRKSKNRTGKVGHENLETRNINASYVVSSIPPPSEKVTLPIPHHDPILPGPKFKKVRNVNLVLFAYSTDRNVRFRL